MKNPSAFRCHFSWLALLTLAVVSTVGFSAQPLAAPRPAEEGQSASQNKPERVEWFRDQGFGMFIHWSVDGQLGSVISHSLPGASDDYIRRFQTELPKTFYPEKFDPRKWARLAKIAGMKYRNIKGLNTNERTDLWIALPTQSRTTSEAFSAAVTKWKSGDQYEFRAVALHPLINMHGQEKNSSFPSPFSPPRMPFVSFRHRYYVALLATASFASAAPGRIDNYASEPRSDYDSRRTALVSSSAASARGSLDVQMARLALNQGALDEAVIRRSLAKINTREDTADFDAVVLLRLYSYDSPLLTAALRKDMRETLLRFKYWVDEPGTDLLSMWSENHQIGYHTAEYLAGQFFPSEIFSNNGKSGAWHRDSARARILRWIEIKAKTGFAEWDSNSYYPVSIGALLNLAELAADKEISDRASMLLDVMFFDMAVDSFRGSYGTSHGRTYTGTVLGGGRGEGTSSLQYLAWGLGAPGGGDAALALATGKRYRVARTVEAIGDDLPAELVNRERQSLLIEDAAKFGLSYSNPDHFWLLNEGGKFRTIENIEAGYRVTELWRDTLHRYGVVIKPYGDAVLAAYRELAAEGKTLPDLDRTSLQRVDKITYRTPDYQLSTAQDYRKGAPGFQQHIWQATVGPDTPVFTFNPGPTHKYWQGRFPRNGQFKNVLVAIYNVPAEQPPGPKTIFPPDASGNAMPSPSPSEDTLVPRTLAVFHRAVFDEVVQKNNWTFARKDHAYLALWSKAPTTWSQKDVLGGEGLVAEGRQNIWLCQLGREAIDGTFASWMEKLSASPLKIDGLSVNYRAPGVGDISFGWDGPLRVNGREEPLNDYARFDNPYCVSPYGSGRYEIAHAGHRLVLDFKTGERRETHSSP